MSYCDFRDQDGGGCVCSGQLWIISTLFLLWPTCTKRRIWKYANMSGGLSSVSLPEGSPSGKPYVNLKLSDSAGDNLSTQAVCLQNVHVRCEAVLPVQLQTVEYLRGNSLPCVLSSWRRFLWSPWMAPISTLLHSLWNQLALFCSYSVWVTMDTTPKWFGLHMNLFISVTWSGFECSFSGAA